MAKFKIISISTMSIVLAGLGVLVSPAQADDLVFCVNKSSRVVTYPASGKCAATAIALSVVSNSFNQPKSHTTTAAIVPKTTTLKVFVPNVLGMDKNQATTALTNAGLKVNFKLAKSGATARVIQVVPKIGSQVAGGSVVTIVLG